LNGTDNVKPIADSQLSGRRLILLLGALNAAGPMSAFLYLPALPSVQAAFAVPMHIAQMTVSVSLTAFACGILLSGPLSDRFGRRPVLIGGMLTFAIGSVLCLLAPTLPVLVMGRAIQALGTATGLVVARAIVIDVFPPEKVFRMIATLTMIMVLANGLSPYFGGLMVKGFGWRSVFVLLSVAGFAMVISAWRFVPETRARTGAGAGMLQAAMDLVRRPVFLAYLVEGGLIIAIFQVFVATTPYLMQNEFHRTPQEFGLFTAFVSGGYFTGNFLVTRFGHRWRQESMLHTGLTMQLGFALAMLALAWLAVPGPYAIYIPMCVLAIGQGLALPQINSAALTLAPQSAGLASSLIGFGQNLISGGSVQFVSMFPTRAGLPMIVFTVGASSFALACLWLVPQGRK
jgi:MFS transporter, DHA1 family, multidrug resistance protein